MSKVNLRRLQEIVGTPYATDDPAALFVYGSDSSVFRGDPWAVARPDSTEQVQALLRYANEDRIPVIPRGSGSGMCGQVVPVQGGVVLDMRRMNRILEINPADVYCRVEPGVVDDDLNRALRPHGVFYPPTPASSRIATIAGEIGNNASGVRSVKYGATRESLLGLKVVLASGDLVTLGTRTRVEASGYQLERLLVGSEGTLGVIVEATMTFVPIPTFRCLGKAHFDHLEDAGDAISAIMGSGRAPSMLELVDKVAITAVNRAEDLGLPEVEAILLFEADGMVREAVDFEMAAMQHLCEQHGGKDLSLSYDDKERAAIFAGRKKLFPSLSRYREGFASTALADDMAVPYSRMAETARRIHDVAERHHIIMTAYGHCGSGCMHTKILMDTRDPEQWQEAREAIGEIYEYVRSVGGTTSAEHGIGLSKAGAFQAEKADSLDLLRAVKRAFDPNNILNPHKMMDASSDWLSAAALRYVARS